MSTISASLFGSVALTFLRKVQPDRMELIAEFQHHGPAAFCCLEQFSLTLGYQIPNGMDVGSFQIIECSDGQIQFFDPAGKQFAFVLHFLDPRIVLSTEGTDRTLPEYFPTGAAGTSFFHFQITSR